MSERNEYKNRLRELGGSDYEIVDGQPNIKGWDVKDENGQYIGEVEELLFDPQSRKVRYIVLDLEGNAYDLDARKVLVPIGIAALHEKDDDVILQRVHAESFRSLPDYDEDNLNEETEMRIRNSFSGASAAGSYGTSDEFYSHDHFNDRNLYQHRTMFRDANQPTTDSMRSDKMNTDSHEESGIRLRSRMSNDMNEEDTMREQGMSNDRLSADRTTNEYLRNQAGTENSNDLYSSETNMNKKSSDDTNSDLD